MAIPEPPSRAETLAYRYRTYTLKDVAEIVKLTPNHLWRCIRAAQDESARKKYGIGSMALRTLPVRGWFRFGREWVIKESDLVRQLNAIHGHDPLVW